MADEIDETNEREQHLLDRNVQKIREDAANMPAGSPGECDKCGNETQRIVDGLCCPCRDALARLYRKDR